MTTHAERQARQHWRDQITYNEARHSCEWNPEERKHWHQVGYAQGLSLYAGGTLSELAYGLDHYTKQGKREHGAYEAGVADGIRQMMAGTAT